MKRRIKALKRLQLQTQELEAQFYLEVQQLEAKYQKLYQPLYDRRHNIITGSHEPTDEEAHWSEEEDEDGKEFLSHAILDVDVFVASLQNLMLRTRKEMKLQVRMAAWSL